MKDKRIRVAEMFAGVGGFHLGLKRADTNFDVIWADQFEPGRKHQFAYEIYKARFPNTLLSAEDITLVNKSEIPQMDLLVGGFPCQDYSVASTAAKGLFGKKGVLWWDIKDVIEAKWPEFIFLENVDRLLTSPGVTKMQPGRDFGMILRTLSDLGYSVTWKVINAADYGFPQKRRRTFIFASREDTKYHTVLRQKIRGGKESIASVLKKAAPLSSSLMIQKVTDIQTVNLNEFESLNEFSAEFRLKRGFRKTGVMVDGQVYMTDYLPKSKQPTTLSEIIKSNIQIDSLYLNDQKLKKFKQLKSGFQTEKTSKTGHPYKYGMGAISFPDPLNKPARTMVTTEHTVSRMSHVVRDPGNEKLRLISPEEAELINTFPEGWTNLEGISNSERYFTMGNALVVNLIKEIGKEISKIVSSEPEKSEFHSNRKIDYITH